MSEPVRVGGAELWLGDCRDVLPTLPADSVHCCVTSPPYAGLRDYGHPDQIGLEPTVELYVAELVKVFREVRRVLRADGTLWLVLGDCHRDKQLVGAPWRVAFALQADGWWLRSDIIWSKPNPMPESVQDRPTRSHEYVFLLSKSASYHFDGEAVKEQSAYPDDTRELGRDRIDRGDDARGRKGRMGASATRNIRSVWTIPTSPYPEAHFATFPPELAERCIKAGCPAGGTALDPFVGAGTTLLAAERLQRRSIGIELNPEYVEMAARRLRDDASLFAAPPGPAPGRAEIAASVAEDQKILL